MREEKRKNWMEKGILWIRENPHCWLMVYWLFYLAAFFGLELRNGNYYLIQCPIDNNIPFIEEFVLFYLSWFVLLAGAQIWSLFASKKDFLRLAFVMFWEIPFVWAFTGLHPMGFPCVRTQFPTIYGDGWWDFFTRQTPQQMCVRQSMSPVRSQLL